MNYVITGYTGFFGSALRPLMATKEMIELTVDRTGLFKDTTK